MRNPSRPSLVRRTLFQKTLFQKTLWSGVAAALLLSLAFAPSVLAEPITFGVDTAHSGVAFKVRHFFTQVPGHFDDFDGTIVYDPENPASSTVELTVQAASIDTGNEDRDDHLRSPDFFHVEKHPTLSFVSTSVKPAGDGRLDVTGDFSLHGVTKRITVPVEVLGMMELDQGARAGFSTEFPIDRKEYGITWNRALDQGGTILGDEVSVSIDVEAVEKTPPAGE